MHGKGSCGIIYGKLPPEIKIDQAEMFNSGAYKYLVATNAIGMGLNLHIKRIVFLSMSKFSGSTRQQSTLEDWEVKQIAGRAGRLIDKGGVVCAITLKDIDRIGMALGTKHNNFLQKKSKKSKGQKSQNEIPSL